MDRPLIGLTTYNQNNSNGFPISGLMHKYTRAIQEADGIPVLIPTGLPKEMLVELMSRIDGLLFTGGGDVAPDLYGSPSHSLVAGVDPGRDSTEIHLVKLAVGSGKPFLGICRGLQMVNVALGGTLYTHIPDQHPNAIKHNYDSGSQREILAHEVVIDAATRLAGIFGETRFFVNSLHHQGVESLAAGLSVSGHALDGLVEAYELDGHKFGMAVQWHPEWLTAYPHARRLFSALIEAAR